MKYYRALNDLIHHKGQMPLYARAAFVLKLLERGNANDKIRMYLKSPSLATREAALVASHGFVGEDALFTDIIDIASSSSTKMSERVLATRLLRESTDAYLLETHYQEIKEALVASSENMRNLRDEHIVDVLMNSNRTSVAFEKALSLISHYGTDSGNIKDAVRHLLKSSIPHNMDLIISAAIKLFGENGFEIHTDFAQFALWYVMAAQHGKKELADKLVKCVHTLQNHPQEIMLGYIDRLGMLSQLFHTTLFSRSVFLARSSPRYRSDLINLYAEVGDPFTRNEVFSSLIEHDNMYSFIMQTKENHNPLAVARGLGNVGDQRAISPLLDMHNNNSGNSGLSMEVGIALCKVGMGSVGMEIVDGAFLELEDNHDLFGIDMFNHGSTAEGLRMINFVQKSMFASLTFLLNFTNDWKRLAGVESTLYIHSEML